MSAGRAEALAELRRQQERARLRVGKKTPVSKGDPLARALEQADFRERESMEDGDFIRSELYKYPASTERLRWARTRDIIMRSSPGPDEDGVYLEMIARQAASIEMVLRREYVESPDIRNSDICDRILVGTFPTINPHAFARRHGSYFFVQVSAGLISFVYQATKAVVLTWKPVPPAGRAVYGFKCEPEDIEEVLAKNSYPVELLRRTLETFLFEGLPRAVGFSPPAPNYQAPLGILTNSNERFVLAHEYSHTLHDALDFVHPGGLTQSEEFASDVFAFHLVAESGHFFDDMPPNITTQGAYFVLTAMDVLRQALDLARHGEIRDDDGGSGHPPVAQRLAVLRDCYLKTVTPEDNDLSIRAALHPANTLQILWKSVLDAGYTGSWTGRQLHQLWETV